MLRWVGADCAVRCGGGMASPLLGVAAQNSLLFTAFSVSKRLVAADTQLSIPQVALAGSLAGGANALLSSPVELLKIRMQAQYTTHSTAPAPAPAPAPPRLRQVAAHIYSSYGLRRGVMRGFWITVAREVPAYAAFYAAFEAAKAAFRSHLHTDNLPVWALMASGSAGGVANWLACYPLDVVKSRVQLTDHRLAPTYIADEFKAIYRQQGAKAFVRGLSPTLLRAIPAAAATFTTFELAKGLLQGTS